MPRVNVQFRLTILLACVAASAIAAAQVKDGASFRTGLSNVNLRIDVLKNTSLSIVLIDLCNRAKVACSGVDMLASDSVPPLVVEGEFLAIVRQLTEGTDVNFEYAHGTSQSPPRLTLLRRTRVAADPALLPDTQSHDAEHNVDHTIEVLPANPLGVDAGAEPASTASLAGEAASSSKDQGSIGESALTLDVMKMYAGGYATAATPSEFLPFPGSDGQPIPSKTVKVEFLPFPDEFGRPIPVTPAKPGSPFPTPTDQQPK